MKLELKLKPIDRDNLREILKLKVSAAESDLVAPVEYSLSEAYVEEDLHPRALYVNESAVGFVMYGKWKGADSYWITRLLVVEEFRRKGYAKAAIKEVIKELFARKDCDRISISFVPKNSQAKALYESLGFRQVGTIEDEVRYELKK